jgi:hypothetical protein
MKKIFLISLIFIFYSCAVIEAPSGGPRDTTPPNVVSYYPENFAINFYEKKLEIEFDKYMNKSSVIQSLSISPKINYDFSWNGKTLSIKFKENLQVNMTYVVKLKPEYSDFRGNKPEQALTFIFATGNKIDSGRVSGKLTDLKPEGKSIFAWRHKDSFLDISNPPDYTVSLGTSGEFELIGLKKGLYRIVAIDDKMKNELYESGIDGFGAAQFDVEVYDEGNPLINLKIGPPFDRTGVSLINAFPTAQNMFQINLSEEIYIDSITTNNFILSDSITGENIQILNVFAVEESKSKKLFAITQILDTLKTYKFQIKELRDTIDNLQVDSLSTAFFGGMPKKFTNKINLLTNKLEPSIKKNDLKFIFSHPIKELLDSAIVIMDKADSVLIENEFTINNNRLNLKLKPKKEESDLILKLDLSKIIDFKKDSGLDSIFTFSFKHSIKKSESKIKGNIIDSTNCEGNKLILLKQGLKIIDKVNADERGAFVFLNVEEGNYNLEIICDENQNMEYDFGNDDPFLHSEFFFIYDKDLKLKKDWDIDDVIIILKQKLIEENIKTDEKMNNEKENNKND